ncbi:MAG: penicillin-binding protein [Frankia sp.]|nr:penicillin-binding protein [Frankia sp.]
MALVAGFFALAGVVYSAARVPLPDSINTEQTTVVSYADGSRLGALQGAENRTDIALDKVPEHVRNAVLAAEDRTFYHHPGVSLSGIARAAFNDVFHRGKLQGGSTIDQQYARNAYLTQRRTFLRKVRESVIALKLNRKYSKDQILEFYLNTIYFGRGAYGVEAAARTYFGVPASRLTVEQGAVLAALIRAPESGDPAVNRELAERRWHSVLDGMVSAGWLARADADAARYPTYRPRGAGGSKGGRLAGPVGHLLESVRKELEAKGFTAAQIYTSGLQVTTTLSPVAQRAAETAVQDVLDDPANDPEAALVAIQPGTGAIRAMYGGRDFVKRQFNNATDAVREPGSSFKPFVLGAALDDGISLRTRFDGHSPKEVAGYPKPISNFNDEQFGNIDLVDATAHSVNTVFVPLAVEVHPSKVADFAHNAGIPDSVKLTEPNGQTAAGIALGIYGVHPIDQAAAFATFADRGRAATPYLVETVRDRRGKVLFRAKAKTHRAFDTAVADDANYAMQQVIERGTATAAKLDGRPAAGKTGTTQESTNAWFCGFTPGQLSAAVWMGYDKNRSLRNVHGVPNVTGGTLPARIWKQFMDAALEGAPVNQFAPPAFRGETNRRGPAPPPRSNEPQSPTAAASVPSEVPSEPEFTPPTQPPPQSSEPPQSSPPPQQSSPPPQSTSPTAAATP